MVALLRPEMAALVTVARLPCGASSPTLRTTVASEVPVLTLFRRMGELEPWIDENFVRNVWFQLGETVNVKMIRDKFSGYALSGLHIMFIY
jgi:hypothetical protein